MNKSIFTIHSKVFSIIHPYFFIGFFIIGGWLFFHTAIPHANSQSHGSPCTLTSQCSSGLCCTVGGTSPNQCHLTTNTHGGTCQSGSTPPPPPPSTDFTRTSTQNLSGITAYSPIRVNLSWSPLAGATEYHIERCGGSSCTNFTEKAVTSATSYADINVSGGNNYRYGVKGHQHSTNKFSYTPDLRIFVSSQSASPPTPTISVSSGCYTTLHLLLGLSTPAGASDYHVYRCTGSTCTPYTQIATVPFIAGNTSPLLIASLALFADTNVTNGTTYSYRIKAHKHNNNTFSSYSNIVIGKPSSCSTTPSTPTLSGSSALSPTRANLSWTSSTGASDYHLYRCSGTTCTPTTQITAITSTNYSDTNVVLGSYYRYSVKAHNHSNSLYSSASNIVTVYVSSSPPPPSSVTFNSSNFSGSASIHCYNSSYQANLSWSRISNANFYFISECSNTTLSSCTAKAFTSAPFFFERNVPPSSIKRYVLASYTTSGAVFQPATNIISVSAPSTSCQ